MKKLESEEAFLKQVSESNAYLIIGSVESVDIEVRLSADVPYWKAPSGWRDKKDGIYICQMILFFIDGDNAVDSNSILNEEV